MIETSLNINIKKGEETKLLNRMEEFGWPKYFQKS